MSPKLLCRRLGLFPGLIALGVVAQPPDDTVRVTVTINPDGSKTIYQSDGANQRTIATTTGTDGKPHGKIIYHLDHRGRYESGQVYSIDGKLRFKTRYGYDAAGRLVEEVQRATDDSVRSRIVYRYDSEGHPLGYAIYDREGRLLGRTSPKAVASPAGRGGRR